MKSSRGSITAWLIFILVIVIAFFLMYYLRNTFREPSTQVSTEEVGEIKTKGFAVPELSPKQKKKADNDSLNEVLLHGSAEDCDKILYDEDVKKGVEVR